MVCTGGPAPYSHDLACPMAGQQLPLGLSSWPKGMPVCEGGGHFRLLKSRGAYACRGEDFRGRCYHIPIAPTRISQRDRWFIHKPCACNHMNALLGRVGKCVPPHDPATIQGLLTPLSINLAKAVGRHQAVPYRAVYANMPAKKRARYARAEKQLKRQGGRVRKWQARIKMFVKLEGIKYTPQKVNPDCRAIQFRS